MSDVTVATGELRQAAKGWRRQHTALLSARSDLLRAESSTSAAGDRVKPSVDAFLSTWIDELKKYANTAERHGDNLDAAASNYDTTEESARAALAKLLPWDRRHSAPGSRR